MENAGYKDVREAIAANLNKRFGTAFDDHNIVMTVGAAGGLNIIFKDVYKRQHWDIEKKSQIRRYLQHGSTWQRQIQL